ILEAGKKLSTLMDDLLRLARLARFETHKKDLDLKKTVAEPLNHLHSQAAGRPVKWQAERLPAVLGDLSELLLAMSNLISNTLKFNGTPSAGRIEICTRTSEARDPIIS